MRDELLLRMTRRHLFRECALGLGSMALASFAGERRVVGAGEIPSLNPLAPRPGHFAPRATSIIYLFMAGGPSQLELFDHKPELLKQNNEPIPESFVSGKRFAFMDTFSKQRPKLLATRRKFEQWDPLESTCRHASLSIL